MTTCYYSIYYHSIVVHTAIGESLNSERAHKRRKKKPIMIPSVAFCQQVETLIGEKLDYRQQRYT